MLLDKLFVKRTFKTKEEYNRLLIYIVGETLGSSMVAIRSIIIFEIFMIAYTVIKHLNESSQYSLAYLTLYILLLMVSIGSDFLIRFARKNIEKNYLYIIHGAQIHSIFMMIWAILITYLDMISIHDYSMMVYMIIMIVIPVATYINPVSLLIQNFIGSIMIGLLIIRFDNSEIMIASFINFFVFAFIASNTGFAYTYMRITNYKKHAMLQSMNLKLKEASEIDFLSGLYNRTKLNEIAERLWLDGMQNQTALACILCDIDNFKQINDTYGHLEGDKWIQELANVLREVVTMENAYCFRYGGEEFLIVIPGVELSEAQDIAESIRTIFEQVRVGNKMHKGTVSCGVYCAIPSTRHNIEKFYGYADDNLYRAKARGKNQVY
jgi:diguanylate cyclase (GGDEF)-like protein